jgi:hypothetical protein
MERWNRRGTGCRCRSRNGGCCGCGNVGRNGRCFGAGSRCCCGRWHECRCGSMTGSRNDARTGCGSGRRCSAGTRRCWGTSTGGRCGSRARGRSFGCCSDRSGCRFRGCSGCRAEGRFGGKDSPSRLGNGTNWDSAEVRIQIPEVRTPGRERTWDTTAGRSRKAEAKSQESNPGTWNEGLADFEFRDRAERTGSLVALANRA